MDLEIGENFNLECTVYPDNATDKDIMFYSENNNIARVNDDGVITAISNGSTKIHASSSNGISTICEVNVHTTPEELLLNKNEINLFVNGTETYQLRASYKPDTSNYKTNITYTSSDSDVATVDENGQITAISSGSATITATSQNNLTATCDVTVNTLPAQVNINETAAIEKGQNIKLGCTISPEDADMCADITWTSSNENIVTVSEDGTITAVANGTATVTARTENGITGKCRVTVYSQIDDFSFDTDSITMDLSKDNTFKVFANSSLGEDITSALTWKVEPPEVATVENGTIKALANGTATITGSINGIEKEINLTVNTSPSNFEITNTVIRLNVEETQELAYTIEPEQTNINNDITWNSSDDDIVEVENGNITAKKAGRVTIMATCNNIVRTCLVIVTDTNSKMNFDKEQLIVQNENSETLLLKFDETINTEDLDLNSLDVTCESDQEGIVEVEFQKELNEENQVEVTVTGKQEGTTVITAQLNEMEAYCEVTVYTEISELGLYYGGDKIIEETMTLDLSRNTHTFAVEAKINDLENNINNVVEWKSSEETVARINKYGEITALKNGETTISAQINDGNKAEFTLKVVTSPTGITGVNSMGYLYVNGIQSTTLEPKVIPSNTTVDYKFTYESSEPSVAEVSEDGTITAYSSGETIITVKVEGEGVKEGIQAQCKVTVRTRPKSVTISETSKYLKIDSNGQLKATISPSDANDSNTMNWTSSNSDIVRVDNNGNIHANKAGTATITVTTANGKVKDSVDIIVPNLVVNVNNRTLDLSTTNTAQISTVGSENIGTLTYTSLNPAVATVDSMGKISAVAGGGAIIRVTENNASTYKEIRVDVITTTQSITLNKTSANLHIYNTTVQLTATQSPSTVSAKGIQWTSSNTSVATVNSNGVVTRVASGTTTIKATATDGSGKSASCTITVQPEKVIIVGASTVKQLANERTCVDGKNANEANAEIGYNSYGYTKNKDLFFVCIGGSGYHWLTGSKPNSQYHDDTEKIRDYGSTGIKKIESILSSDSKSHFTMIFMQGGNDLSRAVAKKEDDGSLVEAMATKYYEWYVNLANKYTQHTIYVFPVTPIDKSNATGNLAKNKFNVSNSNNKKRLRFATKLNDLINNTGNLKYAGRAFNDLNDLQKNGEYVCYDGKHYNKKTARLVFKKIITSTGVKK